MSVFLNTSNGSLHLSDLNITNSNGSLHLSDLQVTDPSQLNDTTRESLLTNNSLETFLTNNSFTITFGSIEPQQKQPFNADESYIGHDSQEHEYNMSFDSID